MFTSGTSGEPKGVCLTVGNLVAGATASAFRLGVDPADRWLCCLPMYHMGGLAPVVRSVLYGTTVVIQREFSPDTTARVIDEYGITGVSLVPTMCKRLLEDDWGRRTHFDSSCWAVRRRPTTCSSAVAKPAFRSTRPTA